MVQLGADEHTLNTFQFSREDVKASTAILNPNTMGSGFRPECRRIDGRRSCCLSYMKCNGQQEVFCKGPNNGRIDIMC
jgi:hypothetical protein